MASLTEQIDSDLKAAMKGGDSAKVSTIRMLKAAMTNVALQRKKAALEDGEVQEVIQRMIKQHQESVEAFTKGGREDLAKKEQHEAQILKMYLPPAMDEEELRTIIQTTIRELGVTGPSALGQVMKAVLSKVKGRADGKRVNQWVSQLLQGGAG